MVGWRLDDVVQIIRGKVGSTVRLQILPAGAAPGSPEKELALTRSKVTLEAQAAQKEVRKIKRGDHEVAIGVINVPSFYQDFEAKSSGAKDYRSTTRDVRKLIEELREKDHVESIIMDLRGNGGGHLTEATALSGLFIPGGPIVQLRETGGRVEVLDDPEPTIAWDGPLIVLVDRFSASASEIFAAAIQDYGRGLVVGQQTYGKGSVQNLYPLDRYALGPDPGFGQLTVTIGKYYRVTGESTQHRGVQPDISMPTAISTEEVGESTRESALPWDRIRPVDFGRETQLSAGCRDARALARGAHRRRSGLPPAGCRSRLVREGAHAEEAVAESQDPHRRARADGEGAHGSRKRAAFCTRTETFEHTCRSQWRRASGRRACRDDGDRSRPDGHEGCVPFAPEVGSGAPGNALTGQSRPFRAAHLQ